MTMEVHVEGTSGKTDDVQKKSVFNGDINTRVTCTGCFQQINIRKPESAWRHPLLRVLLCKKCYGYYTSGEIAVGDDGVDEQCRWCGQGGKLIGCDFCHNAFCKSCIKKNLGRDQFAATSAESWRCYVCDSTPLKPLVSYCSSVLEFISSQQDEGNVKDKQKHSSSSKAESVASSSSVSPSAVFSGSNISEVLKLLKSATEPLQQLIAEAEEEIAKDSQLAESSGPQQKYETLASKLKTEYAKSVDALSAVKMKKVPADVKHCTDATSLPIVSVERLSQSLKDQTNASGIAGDSVMESEDLSSSRTADSINNSSRASRADIEAQRDLHKQMLSSKDESSESDGSSSESSTSSEDEEASSSEESDDDDEYDPKNEIRQAKLERGHERRTTMKKQKMRAAVRQLKEIRERMKKNRMKKRRASKHKSDDDDDGSAKKASKKSKQKRKKSRDAEDAEMSSHTDKESSSLEKKSNRPKQKRKKTSEEHDDNGSDGDVSLEDDESNVTEGKKKGCPENSSKKTDDIDSGEVSTDEVENCVDENDDAENNEKGKQTRRSKRAGKGTKSDSTTADDSLDKELKNLGKLPKLKIKANSGKILCEEVDSVKNGESCAAETVKSKPEGAKKGSRRRLVDELSSGEEGDSSENQENASAAPAMDADESLDAIPLESVENSENIARQELLDEIEDDEQEDDEQDDDDEDEDVDGEDKEDENSVKGKGNKSKKQKTVTIIDSAEDVESAAEEKQKKKRKKSSKLLRAKLSDSDDDDDDGDIEKGAAGKRKKKNKKAAQRDEESESDADSDVVTRKKKKVPTATLR